MIRLRGQLPAAATRTPAKLDAWVGTIDQTLEDDKACGKKQRHTAKRIFERLHDEHSYTGGYTIVNTSRGPGKLSQREMFVPLEHPPGDAQADFGEGAGRDRRRGTQGALPGGGPATIRRLLRDGVPG
jgi:hypothetical protein